MTDTERNPAGEASSGERLASATSRRRFLKATAGTGALAAGVGSGLVGSAGAEAIPTPWLHRDGNVMRDPSDNRVTLRGLNIPDPKRNDVNSDWRPSTNDFLEWVTDEERDWYARLIRLPVQPLDIGGHDPGGIPPMPGFTQDQLDEYVEKYLTPAVEKCAELGVYCIVDYHRHREQGEEYLYTSEETHEELTMFWETIAPLYAEYSHVIYEVYNEPIGPFPGEGNPNVNVDVTDQQAKEEGWDVWKEAAQPWVDTIREHAPRNPVIIGSPRWSQYTYWASENEFDGDNLGYVGHVYAQEGVRPLDEYFGTPAEEVPVWMTEFGWAEDGGPYLVGSAEEEGQDFLDFFEEHDHVHNTVWCFDAKWSPAMLEHDYETLRDYGQFWKDFLYRLRDADLPAGDVTTPTEPDDETPTPTEPEDEDVPPVGNNTAAPTDPDGDGLYEDVNGNGDGDLADAVDLYQNRGADEVTGNVDAYDFSGNEEIDLADVVQLYQENTS